MEIEVQLNLVKKVESTLNRKQVYRKALDMDA